MIYNGTSYTRKDNLLLINTEKSQISDNSTVC